MQGAPVPDPSRSHDISGLTDAELERTRRELQASLAQSGWRTRLTGVSAVGVYLIAGVLRGDGLAVHSVSLAAVGALLFACGIALAVWARLHLGRNWGMPMTQRAEPELVTSGPYRFVRHPIYTRLLTAMLGPPWPTTCSA